MASIQKFKASEVSNQIRHIERTIENPSNEDIDKEKISEDYLLLFHFICPPFCIKIINFA